MISKGGSSRVYCWLNHANEVYAAYAIKRVTLETIGAGTLKTALLRRLDGNNCVIRLINSEVRPGPGVSKRHLLLVVECGEIDFARSR